MILPIYSAAITCIPPLLKQSLISLRVLEFQFGGSKFNVRLHRLLD